MRKKLLPILSLAAVISTLGAYKAINKLTSAWDPNEANIWENPIVKYGENGQVVKINDPEDPVYSTLKSINIKNSVISLFIYKDNKGANVYESQKINFTVTPAAASTNGLTFTSSNPGVAKVDANGVVTAVKEGTAEIRVANATGTIQASSHVVVNENKKSIMASRISNIQNAQSKNPLTDIYVEEQYTSTKQSGASKTSTLETVSTTEFVEKFWASKEKNYFRIVEEEREALCNGGSPVLSRVDYIFYCQDHYTYIFKTDGQKKNYMCVDQSFYVGEKSNYESMVECLGNFFTAGSAIITNQYNLASGADFFEDGITPDYFGGLSTSTSQMAVQYKEENGGRVGQEDADYFEIPVGTNISVRDNTRYLFESNYVTHKHLVEEIDYTYKKNDKSIYELNTFDINYYFKTKNVDLLIPDVKDYELVDDIFSL